MPQSACPWGHWDVIDYLIGTAADLGAGLRRFERYFAVISTGVSHVLEEHGLPMARPDPELGRILEKHAELLVGQLGTESDLVSRVRRRVPLSRRPGALDPGDRSTLEHQFQPARRDPERRVRAELARGRQRPGVRGG